MSMLSDPNRPNRQGGRGHGNVLELPTAAVQDSDDDYRPSGPGRMLLIGVVVVLVAFGGLGGWAATAPLDSAAMAPGTIAVESNRKLVEHLDGGVVEEVLVREGDTVAAGDVLLRMEPTEAEANFQAVRQKLDSALAMRARLVAERTDEKWIDFPEELDRRWGESDQVDEVIEGEFDRFRERRDSLAGEVALREQKIEQLREEIRGLEAQRDSNELQAEILRDELVGLRSLYEKGYYPRTRLLEKEREVARLTGEAGSAAAGIARAQARISEVRSEISQLRQKFNEDVAKQLRETEDEISELRQSLVVNRSRLNRATVRAPHDGVVQDLSVHSKGEVIRPGDTILQIIPVNDRLVIEARVNPTDIDVVREGQSAEVRLTALSTRATPVLTGKVVTVSPDRFVDEDTDQAYYRARVSISSEELSKLEDKRLQAGMPAEVLISTGEQTLLGYLVRPLTDAMARGFIEK